MEELKKMKNGFLMLLNKLGDCMLTFDLSLAVDMQYNIH